MAARKNCVLAAPIDPRAFVVPTDVSALPFSRRASTPSSSEADLPLDVLCVAQEALDAPATFDDANTREVCARDLLQAQIGRSATRRTQARARTRTTYTDSPQSPLRPRRRRPRAADLFAFFVRWKRIEHQSHEAKGSRPRPTADTLLNEFLALSGPLQYYWTHMHELWLLYQRQQLALRSPLRSVGHKKTRTRELLLTFYYLDGPAQKLLVDDWIAECTARQREFHAEKLETCLARKTLVKIKADVLALVASIDYVLRESRPPRNWPATVAGV